MSYQMSYHVNQYFFPTSVTKCLSAFGAAEGSFTAMASAFFSPRGHAEVSFIPRERADLKDLEEYQLGNSRFQWFQIPVESEWNVKLVVR